MLQLHLVCTLLALQRFFDKRRVEARASDNIIKIHTVCTEEDKIRDGGKFDPNTARQQAGGGELHIFQMLREKNHQKKTRLFCRWLLS